MPQLIIAPIASFIVSAFGVSAAVAGVAAGVLVYGAALGLTYAASTLIAPPAPRAQRPSVPKPGDGSYNIKQNVPSRAYVLGTVKKGGDYVFLEEGNGIARHIMVWAAHRISGYVAHYCHDLPVSIDSNGAVTDAFKYNENSNVFIESRVGLKSETAYASVVWAFPSIWNSSCRGDGLASVAMTVFTVPQQFHLDTFPNQMPEHSAVGNGALLYDPRKDSSQPGGVGPHRSSNPDTWEFSRNLALMRLWHLCHPVGGKLAYTDLYMPEWMVAANVADGVVVNRSGGFENRYHGGFWFRADNDPIEVGRIMDDAGEMVIYERPDGLIGVHPGQFVEPDITLTGRHIIALRVDKNRRKSSNVLAVRGRYVNPARAYVTEDAAIFGNPYGISDDSTERTRTYDNVAIQSHNHCQRKQKLTLLRANARRVTMTCDYSYADVRRIRSLRFIRAHYPSRGLVNANIEIVSRVAIDIRNMRVSFEGIVWDTNFYEFDSATEEGAPGTVPVVLSPAAVPVPAGFTASVQTEIVAGGSSAAFIAAQWVAGASSLSYELEVDRVSGSTGPVQIFVSTGASAARTEYLADGVQYKIRLRAWGGGRYSGWTDYIILTMVADPVAPGPVTGATVTGGAGTASYVWTAPNSANYAAARLYLNTVDSFSGATLLATEYGSANIVDGRTLTGLTAGSYYGFVVAINGSGVASSEVSAGSFEVT